MRDADRSGAPYPDPYQVLNQPPPLEDYNAFEQDAALREAVEREGAGWARERLRAMGAAVGSAETIKAGFLANRCRPELRSFDRYGHRIDEVEYHPAYHDLMRLAMQSAVHSIAWTSPAGGHAAHTALAYLLCQTEPGVCCPMAMTYAAVPALRHGSDIAAEWEPRMLVADYDRRFIPAAQKTSVTFGMAMTEKQSGSDVRTNLTRARALGASGADTQYELYGHKWFCSAPMSDAFLTLASTNKGLSCFLVPRFRPDGSRNPFAIQRLKDKLGNHSNASAEIEYHGTWARMVGEEGRGVRTIIDMVHHTRLDCAMAAAALMRQAVAQATHHAFYREAFGRRLVDHPLMRNVLADLALEAEAALALVMRVARAFDSASDPQASAFARVAVAVAKYWLNKRVPGHVAEALECLGGAGYVEESMMPRLYREAPLNGIWEGCGNIMCLDVLRSLQQEPQAMGALLAEIQPTHGADRRLDARIAQLNQALSDSTELEVRARRLAEALALTLQGALLVQHAPPAVADAFCASRLGQERGQAYGSLPPGLPFEAIIERARPQVPRA
jgi:putative acyl-CoA dehydrogenase